MSKPDYSGTYHVVEQDNMDAYLAALGNISRLSYVPLFAGVQTLIRADLLL